MKMQAWDVLLIQTASDFGDMAEPSVEVQLPFNVVKAYLVSAGMELDYYMLDTVFYDSDCDSQYVKRGLIEHDGYPTNIVVRKAR